MSAKRLARVRRSRKTRMNIKGQNAVRLSVHRTSQHIYAQIVSANGDQIITHASTLDKSIRSEATSNIEAASKVGKLIAERAKAANIEKVAFDRSGFKYHGRVKALADAARESGLAF